MGILALIVSCLALFVAILNLAFIKRLQHRLRTQQALSFVSTPNGFAEMMKDPDVLDLIRHMRQGGKKHKYALDEFGDDHVLKALIEASKYDAWASPDMPHAERARVFKGICARVAMDELEDAFNEGAKE